MCGRDRELHLSGAGPQRGGGGEQRGAGHLRTARHDQHAAACLLVALLLRPGDRVLPEHGGGQRMTEPVIVRELRQEARP